jgi:hypothetical protein
MPIRILIQLLLSVMCNLVIQTGFSLSNPEEEYSTYLNKYPDEPVIYTLRKHDLNYRVDKDSVITTIKVYEEMLHLGDNTARFVPNKVYSNSFRQLSDLQVYTLVPKKKNYERINVAEFTKSYDTDSDVFYDDKRETRFLFPSIQRGVKTVLEYTITIKNPHFIDQFIIDSYLPVENAMYSVTYDKQITLNPRVFNAGNINISKKTTALPDDQTTIQFSAEAIPKIKFAANCPSYRNLAASIYCPIVYYANTKRERVDVISTPEVLHKQYRTFIKDIQNRDPRVEAILKTIVDENDSDLVKVKKVFAWVQANIKYIAFEDGMRGFIPHPGHYVIEKRYGDCKDMTSATVSLLREAGIEAQYTWVGTRDLPYRYSDIASSIADNHMIATVTIDSTTYYLDATGQYLPIGLPSSMIQGKECLISIDEKEFRVEQAPVIPKEINILSDTLTISLENGTVKGKGKVDLTGFARYYNAFKLIKANKKDVDDYVKKLLTKGSNKFMLSSYEVSNLSDVYTPINIGYEFTIPDYYREVSGNIYINLVLDKTMTDALIESREVPIENDYKYINRSVVRLKLPAGYFLKDLPKDANGINDNFGFNIHFEEEGDDLIVSREFYVNYLVMAPDSFESWNSIITQYANSCRKAIVLSKK